MYAKKIIDIKTLSSLPFFNLRLKEMKISMLSSLQLQKGKKNKPRRTCLLWRPRSAISPSNSIQGYLWPTFWIMAAQAVLFLMFSCWELNVQAEAVWFSVKRWVEFLWKFWKPFQVCSTSYENDRDRLSCKLKSALLVLQPWALGKFLPP